ncbi:MAG: ethanolamine ammonia-lyase subunit EutB, partial [Planctomycetota bacterium]|nr:ethanolamine ammonia-lyase subunit EutB [Planctomycetota bacterium]
MLHRRRFLALGLTGGVIAKLTNTSSAVGFKTAHAVPGESIFGYIQRTLGQWDAALYKRLLGAANEFKEGDAIIGVAAIDDNARRQARDLMASTRLSEIDQHPPFRDDLFELITSSLNRDIQQQIDTMTLGALKAFLLQRGESEIHAIRDGLSSDVIACVVRLMSNAELIQIGAKVFNPLPESRIGARGYMGARVQPNSPTDNIDDIRWQVFDAFAYAVGDVLLGTNPVSSTPESVAAVEECLKDVLATFELEEVLPHCVLAHVDVQAAVESAHPGLTALWFQSIAGNDTANATFDISVDKMQQHAASRHDRFGLYFETGQGADFTNGHSHGVDMVLHESRKYGFARSLSRTVAASRESRDSNNCPWMILNDVAGFIGPEVFRSREQLVRCCLEDIVMGKLHGLTIGLDICSTLHMDVSLDDLGWCIDQIMPANPGYLMALPTRIDPMLGYLTTGFQDHVHIREKFGFKVNDRMWQFFQRLGVIDAEGQPTEYFGDPSKVYLQYCRRKNDVRSDQVILSEAATRIAEVRSRGVFIAEGFGDTPSILQPSLAKHIHHVYEDAKISIWMQLDDAFVATVPNAQKLKTRSVDRTDYILHPVSGEHLSEASAALVARLRNKHNEQFNTQVVISDGLNALALMEENQLLNLIHRLRTELTGTEFLLSPENLLVDSGRVRAGYRIGEQLFGGRDGTCTILHIIGERPGSGHHTLSIYMTRADGRTWGIADN